MGVEYFQFWGLILSLLKSWTIFIRMSREYETAPECDAVINASPAYDEDSTDQSQILG